MKRSLLCLLVVMLAASPACARVAPSRKIPGTVMVPVDAAVVLGTNSSHQPRWVVTVKVGSARLVLYGTSRKQAEAAGRQLAARLDVVAARVSQLARCESRAYGSACALAWDGRVIWVVTAAQAADYGLTPARVVETWVAALKAVRPQAAALAHIAVPRGETRWLALPAGWSHLAGYDKARLEAKVRGGLLAVKGLQSGRTTLVLKEHRLEIDVQEPAGTLPWSLHLAYSGPYERDLVLAGLEHLLGQRAMVAADARLWTCWDMLGAGPRVTVWAEGENLAAQVRNLAVSVDKTAEPPAPPEQLVASNNPERVYGDGVLADEVLKPGTSWYYYEHQNSHPSPSRVLRVRIRNAGASPARLMVAHSGAGPSTDEIYVGHVATWRFFQWEQQGNAWEVEIPAGGSYPLDRRWLAPDEIAAGMGLIQVVAGSDLHFEVEASGGGDVSELSTPQPVRARGTYAEPSREVEGSYAVGGPYAFIDLGGAPYLQSEAAIPDFGNYGVLYRVKLHLANPTPNAVRVFAVFAAGGGAARGSLQVDGRFMETPLVGANGPGSQAPREAPLADWTLDPGATRDVTILAIPEPGSNYPVRIIVKPLPANK